MTRHDRQLLEQIRELLIRLDAAVVVRDPGSARAAEAFDGLRNQINKAAKNRRTHQAHLLSLHDSLRRGAAMELIRDRVSDYLSELGLAETSDTGKLDLFDIVEGEGEGIECLEPAWVETLENGAVSPVRLGKARRVPLPEAIHPEPEPHVEETSGFETASALATAAAEITVATVSDTPAGLSSKFVAAIGATCLVLGGIIGLAIGGDDNSSPAEKTVLSTPEPATSQPPAILSDSTSPSTTKP